MKNPNIFEYEYEKASISITHQYNFTILSYFLVFNSVNIFACYVEDL